MKRGDYVPGAPEVGSRWAFDYGKGCHWVGEYIGPNPSKEFELADACLIKTIETFHGGPPLGNVVAVEPRWFDYRKEVRS